MHTQKLPRTAAAAAGTLAIQSQQQQHTQKLWQQHIQHPQLQQNLLKQRPQQLLLSPPCSQRY
jgi:hypothetical protein